jgi:23S rRNA (uracil1939-C5)-methyltransferase/tRNA (uracil-5-)-methyltransferase
MQAPKHFVPQPFAYHEEVELRIDSLSNLGLGIGRVDGWVVMVPFVVPGERVRARVHRNFKSYSEADLLEVLEPSPDRVEPRCPLFSVCGGCQYQHVRYGRQLEEKRRQVVEALGRIGGIEAAVDPVHGSPRQYGYRSKITPHYKRAEADGSQPIGFLRHGRRHALVDVAQCPIATDAINEALPEARQRARREGGKKRRRRGGTLLLRDVLEGVVGDPQAVVSQRVGELTFQFKAGEFFQNNPSILPDLVAHVAAEASAGGARFLVDAYCGSGLFALSAAASFERVAGVEISEPAVRWARANAEINGVTNVRFVIGQADAVFRGLDFPAEACAVVIDPPRRGCDARFLEQLLDFRPKRLVYVSCEPSTQARDLRQLVDRGYALTRVRPFDLFPHTRHVENIVSLELEK